MTVINTNQVGERNIENVPHLPLLSSKVRGSSLRIHRPPPHLRRNDATQGVGFPSIPVEENGVRLRPIDS